MGYRRSSVIHQPGIPGLPAPDPLLALLSRRRRQPRLRKPRPSAADKRLQAARRDPRQISIFGAAHTDELTGW